MSFSIASEWVSNGLGYTVSAGTVSLLRIGKKKYIQTQEPSTHNNHLSTGTNLTHDPYPNYYHRDIRVRVSYMNVGIQRKQLEGLPSTQNAGSHKTHPNPGATHTKSHHTREPPTPKSEPPMPTMPTTHPRATHTQEPPMPKSHHATTQEPPMPPPRATPPKSLPHQEPPTPKSHPHPRATHTQEPPTPKSHPHSRATHTQEEPPTPKSHPHPRATHTQEPPTRPQQEPARTTSGAPARRPPRFNKEGIKASARRKTTGKKTQIHLAFEIRKEGFKERIQRSHGCGDEGKKDTKGPLKSS
nr:proteoglycan 4-like [Penaeus vannamei]